MVLKVEWTHLTQIHNGDSRARPSRLSRYRHLSPSGLSSLSVALFVTLTAFVIIEFCNNLFKLSSQPGKYLQEIASDYESTSHTHAHKHTQTLSHSLFHVHWLLAGRPCLLFAVKTKTKVVHACVCVREKDGDRAAKGDGDTLFCRQHADAAFV